MKHALLPLPPALPPCPRIGVTGGIGSGKSLVCRMLSALSGAPVYDADTRAKALIESDAGVRRAVAALLGDEAYGPDGAYQRAYVAERVFGNPALLQALNAIVHPAVEADSRQWHEAQCAAGAPYTLKEAALLVESGAWRYLDLLIVVTAPEDLRLDRTIQRDQTNAEAVRMRMRRQWPEDELLRHAHIQIANDGKRLLGPQIWAAHRAIVGIRARA
ncbi:MAG: dephospho-CoA kinase [Saprospiraceae bacterium]